MARDEFIRARVAGWEKRYITDKAKKAHMSESEFVRRAAMNKEVAYIEGLDGLITELRHQGNNLNQLTILARQGALILDYKPFMEVYREVWQALNLLASRVV